MKINALMYFVTAASLLSVGAYWRNLSVSPEPAALVAEIEQNIARELTRLDKEASIIKKSISENLEWPSGQYSFFLRDTTGVIKWNTNHYFPEPSSGTVDSAMYLKSHSGHFLVKQFPLPADQYLIGYIPLQTGFPIQNQYLNTTINQNIFINAGVTFNLSDNAYPITYHGHTVFSISINSALTGVRQMEILSWIAFSLGVIFLLFSTWIGVKNLVSMRRQWMAALLIFLCLLGLRMLMVYGQFPGTGIGWTIFNPKQFASSSFNDTIGNLMLNTLALLATALAAVYLLNPKNFSRMPKYTKRKKVLFGSFFLILCFASQLLPFLYLETLYHNSAITPDISQALYFDSARLAALVCVIASSLTAFCLLLAFFRLGLRIIGTDKLVFLAALLFAVLLIFSYHFSTERHYEIPIVLTVVNLTILYFASVWRAFKFISSRPFSLILFSLIVFSVQASLAIRLLSQERQRDAMIKFGNSFLIERDILGEYLLDQAMTKVETDLFIQQQIMNPFNRLNAITQKIKHHHLDSYFDRYDTRIYLFDNRGQAVGDKGVSDLTSLVKDFAPLAEGTDYRGIYFINSPLPIPQSSAKQFLMRYLVIVPIKFHVTGYIVMDLTLRQILPVNVFPKLLLDGRFSDYANSTRYSFAFLNNGQLTNESGEYDYSALSTTLRTDNRDVFMNGIFRDEYYHVGIEGRDGPKAIVSSPEYSISQTMTNFAFYFLIGLLAVALAFVSLNFKTVNNLLLTYSDRIQVYFYLALVLPLVVVTMAMLKINSLAEEKRFESDNATQAVRMAKNVANLLSEAQSDSDLQEALVQQSQTMATVDGRQGVDVTVFSKKGQLLASSQPGIFTNQLVSRFIPPAALAEMALGKDLFVMDDEVGMLKFRNTYTAVRDQATGDLMAILSLPFFESKESLEKNQIRLVSTILVIFVFVFLFFYLLSFIALNWLTAPLRIIAASLKRTTLSGENKKLSWQSKDEIGSMVHEYNAMVDNLEKSRAELERRQREAAWREMAKQVAHEIKNPLTPIKLTLQQMEKSFQEGRAVPEKAIQSVRSVLHQVDILNEIASSFSAFAQMPELTLERTDINALLGRTVSLFTDSAEGKILFEPKGEPVNTRVDKKLFNRIFSNIIINALQSRKENELVTINIGVMVTHSNCVISFSDNGQGIRPDLVDKIFIPYFSTKETGSGLGLAIAKQGIEQTGGKIWCESIIDKGTSIFISLPLVR